MTSSDQNKEKDKSAFTRDRLAMVDRLRRHYHIRDERVLDAMGRIPRHLFVPEALRSHSYGDYPLPIDHGQTISQPFIVARQTELLGVSKDDPVLEIGAGSGYQTAILAQVAARVFALERIPEFARNAQKVIHEIGVFNAAIKCFDGTYGWNEFAPFRAILVAAAAPEIPQPLINQLAEGGRMVIPVGTDKEQRLIRVTRTEKGIETEDFGACQFVKLIGRFGWEK
ncbi:MAG: protein-L-isoaspartate(D-aspartate) O-methyltransferase [Acidobacteria bacterium]|nr:protein-L-isoaspartate(D-aspartate) O-methyltransferase [Acidobacteriota bacterium]